MKESKKGAANPVAEENGQAQKPNVENQEPNTSSIKAGDKVFIAARNPQGFDYIQGGIVTKVKSKGYHFDDFGLEIPKEYVFTEPKEAMKSEKRYQFK